MRNRSVKRAAQERRYLRLRKEHLAMIDTCQVEGCEQPATDIHHRAGRLGERLTDTTLFLSVCRAHHNYIENHPAEAREKGYSLSRLSKEVSELKKA